jgi:UDP-GlcNAc:undecaprenyl-phosphate GlcNAc-1-phosphate transferase
MMTGNLIAFISAVIISFVMTPWARKLAIKVGALDIPKESRKIHNKPMPYFGGLAFEY